MDDTIGVMGPMWPQRTETDKAMQKTFGNPGVSTGTPANVPGEYIGVLGSMWGRTGTDIQMQKEFGMIGKGAIDIMESKKRTWGGTRENFYDFRTRYDMEMQKQFNPFQPECYSTLPSGFASTLSNPNNPMPQIQFMKIQ